MTEKQLTGRPDPTKPTESVTSSGGVVLNPDGHVLILRRKQEGTWVLPKGKAEPGETLIQTALREVEEETGLKELKVIRQIGLVRYIFLWRPDDKNYKKTVHYFLMRINGIEQETVLEPDFSTCAWEVPSEALKMLTFENDRRIVRSIVD